jgi:hypothetical protein
MAAPVDPIFAVIERHRAALDHQRAAREHLAAMTALYPPEQEPDGFWTEWSTEKRRAWRDAEYERTKGNPRRVAHSKLNDAIDAVWLITDELLDTVPTTFAGIAATLAHWANVVDEDTADRDFQRTMEFMEYIAEAARRLAPRGGGGIV